MRFIRVNYILLLLSLCIIKTEKCYSEITNQQNDRIEGTNAGGTRWAYEFIDDDLISKKSLVGSSKGMVIFQNDEWIVKANLSKQSTTSSKTELSFYDARTLMQVASVNVPNLIVKVGIIPQKEAFYVLNSTPHKYNYDDAPLAICLIDPKKKQIDRIKLIEGNHWLALENPASITSKDNQIIFSYDVACNGSEKNEYISSKLSNPHFKDINVLLNPVANGSIGNEGLIQISEKEFKENSANNLAALSNLGITLASKIPFVGNGAFANAQEFTGDSVAETDGSHKSIHLVRGDNSGRLFDTSLDALKSAVVKVSTSHPIQPGVFSDGTLRCVVDQKPVYVKNGTISYPDVPKSAWFFNNKNAFSLPLRKSAMGTSPSDDKTVRRFENLNQVNIIAVDSKGPVQRCDISASPKQTFLTDALEKAYSIFPEKNKLFTLSRVDQGGENIYIHRRFNINDGSESGCSFTNSTPHTGAGYCEDGKATDGWHLISHVGEVTTSSLGYKLIAKSDDGKHTVTIAEHLPEIPKPCELRTNNSGNIVAIYSYSGTTTYGEFARDGGLINKVVLKSTPQEGSPLLLSEKNLIFIPKAGGYDAYRIFGERMPEKAFEIYFGGGGDYIILLPNGFYAGSPGCERLITLQSGDGKVDASALAPWRNRPTEVIKAQGGDPKTADILGKVTDRWLKKIKFDSTRPEPKASEFPTVEVNQMPPLWAQGAGVTFPIEVKAGASPMTEVTLRVNGISLQTISGSDLNIPSGGKGTVQGSLSLAQGQNWIEVTATDEKGRVSNQAHFRSILLEALEKPKRYIVSMGCSEYDRPELNLQFAAKDAGDVLKTFQEAGGRECKTLLLTNKEVGPEALEKIKAFVGEAKESDEVILFCAGHGLLDEHLDYIYAGHQINLEHPGDTGIHLDALLDAIKAGKSLKRLVLMDTCQSGVVGEKEEMKLAEASSELPHGVRALKSRALKVVGVSPITGDDQQRFIEEMFLLPGQHRGINIIGASGGAEYAMESDKWNNGVFTSALIEALRDKKADMDHRGRISVSDLKTYLEQRVPELTGGAQKPSVVAFEQDQDFDLVGNMPPPPKGCADMGQKGARENPISVLPTQSEDTLQGVILKYHQAIQDRDESTIRSLLQDQVDYYKAGMVPMRDVLADIKGDWKRYSNTTYQVSDFQKIDESTYHYVLDYEVVQGAKIRKGKLAMTAKVSFPDQKISAIKAIVVKAE